MNRKLALFVITVLLGAQVVAEARDVTKVGTTAAPFLTIGVGARPLSMGGAFTAVSNDASALFWNVGGIAQLDRPEIIFNHSDWLADINFEFAGVAVPVGTAGVFGVSITNLNMGEFEQTTEDNPEGTGVTFSAGSFAVGLSYARRLTDKFMIGFTGKYIQEDIYNSSASGFALDVGALFTTPFDGLRLGISISNFGGKMQMSGDDLLVQVDINKNISGNNDQLNALLETGQYDLPLLFRFGLAYDLVNNEKNTMTLVSDVMHPNDNAQSVNAGAEYVYDNMLALRGGYKALFLPDSEEGFTVGGGIRQDFGGLNMQLDYAFEHFGRLDNVQKFTIFLRL